MVFPISYSLIFIYSLSPSEDTLEREKLKIALFGLTLSPESGEYLSTTALAK